MKSVLSFILIFASLVLSAQQSSLVRSGSIVFEKRVNTYALFKKAGMPESWYENYKSRKPQFFTSQSILQFGRNESLFSPLANNNEVEMINSIDPFPFAGQNNIVYMNLKNAKRVSKKKIYSQEILIQDSLNHIKWKLTDEFREVAGFKCRRANGLLMDSIYVVAFYTDAIHYSAGPESFTGLPGMILEVFLPHDNVSWKALSVNTAPVPMESIVPPSSTSKAISRKELEQWTKVVLKNVNSDLRTLLERDFIAL